MIYFDSTANTFYLENERISYAFAIHPLGFPEHLYFGPKTGRDLVPGCYSQKGLAHQGNQTGPDGKLYNLCRIPQEVHTPLAGDYGEPTLLMQFADGSRRSDLSYDGYEILAEKPALQGLPSLRGRETLAVHFHTLQMGVTLFYTIYDDTDIVARSIRLENRGTDDVKLSRAYSFALSLPADDYQVLSIHGAAGAENQLQRAPLAAYGTFTVDSKRGNSSAIFNPFLGIARKDTTENAGWVYGANLVYSGGHVMKAENMTCGLVKLTGGLQDFDFSWELHAGEIFDTPEAVLAFSAEGFSGMSRAYHKAYKRYLMQPQFAEASRPVVFNHWEGTRFTYNADKLKSIVDKIAGRGIDIFAMDDGWFGKRDDATSGLGDWFVNEKKLQGPLSSFIDYVHKKGMKFGIWVEPEMVSPDSDLYQAHPDWAIAVPDFEPVKGRFQYYLDLSRKDVRDYIVEKINTLIDSYEIDYVKWDCNRDMTEGFSALLPAGRQQEQYHRQMLGLYDMLTRINLAHPHILFEGCASGGSRVDPGMLAFFPQIWISDQSDVAARAYIQYGASVCYPLTAHSCHVTASPNRRAGHITGFADRGIIAHLGATGYEFDSVKLPPADLESIAAQVAEYRKDEELVLRGELYRLISPYESNYFAEELILPEKNLAKVVYFKFMENFNLPDPRLYPLALKADAKYLVPELGRTMTGSSWMNFGIVPEFPQGDFKAMEYHFIEV